MMNNFLSKWLTPKHKASTHTTAPVPLADKVQVRPYIQDYQLHDRS